MPKPEFDVFLSHASADKPVVEELARILKRRGIEPWLDAWNLVPGAPWQEALEEALERCATCAVFIGRDGTGPWQNEEMRAAIERQVVRPDGYVVIPVLLPSAERGERSRLPAFLVRRTWVEFHDSLEDERVLHRLICGIRRTAPGPAPGEAVAEGACPYRGLRFFDVGDSIFFQGREALTGWLLAKLQPARLENRFLAITGPSGSGKSSLARAGLLAALGNGEIPGSADWPVAVCRPGAQPLESLAVALAGALEPAGSAASLPGMIRDLGSNPRMLHLTSRFALRAAPADRRLVVLIDQFEEVFTLCTDESQRGALIANLLHAAREVEGQTAVILTLRSDFYGRCAAFPELASALSDRNTLVGPMTEEELRSAIEEPARTAGLELEGGLADLLIGEVEGQPGCLPLLQHALLQIWERRQGRRLTVAAYRDIGGMAGALEQHAEQVFASFTGSEPEACRRALLRLVQVDETGSATKRRLGLEELISPSDPETDRRAAEAVIARVIARLTGERLLTAESIGEDRHPTVELAHEALLSSWKRLEDWIDAGREALRTRRRLDEAVHEWQESGREPSYLYSGARLAQAAEWAAANPGEPSEKAREFLSSSATRESRQRRRAMILLASAAMVAALVAATMFWLRNQSERQRRINLAAQMAGQAQSVLPLNPLISLLLATEALRGKDDLPAAKGALLGALALSDAQPLGRPGIVTAAASADRRSMATASRDGAVQIWSFASGAPKAPERSLRVGGPVAGLALSSDRRWLLVRNGDAEVRLLDLRKENQGTLLPDENWRPGDPFSLDSRWLITQRWGQQVQRDLAGGSRPAGPPSFTFSLPQDSRRWLATATESGAVRLADLASRGRDPIELPGQGRPVKFLFFVRGDRWLVTQAGDEAPRLWDLSRYLQAAGVGGSPLAAISPDGGLLLRNPASGKLAPRAVSWPGPITALALHPERRLLALGGKGAASLWDLGSGAPRVVSTDPDGQSVSALAFGSRPPSLAIGWDKGRVVIVPLDKDGFLAAPSRDAPITALAFSPDGKALAISDANGKVWIWSPDAKEIPLANQDRTVQSLAFSGDGRRLAGGGKKGTVQLWSLDDSRVPLVWQGHAGPILNVSFAEDGKELITTGAKDTVRHWPLDNEALIRLACKKAGRNLTEEEWKALVPQGERFREGTPCGELPSS